MVAAAAGNRNSGRAEEAGSVVSRRGVTVAAYCEKFAREYSKRNEIGVMTLISNVFQPSDSPFTAEYDCRFRAGDAEGRVHDVSSPCS